MHQAVFEKGWDSDELNAHDAFDNGVLTLELTRLIENCDKHWVSQIECSRHILGVGSGNVPMRLTTYCVWIHPTAFVPLR
jgi:hypothetical protein